MLVAAALPSMAGMFHLICPAMPALLTASLTASLRGALRAAAFTTALAAAVCVAPATAAASPLSIDFEQFAGVDYMPGTPIAAASRLSEQLLASHGVRFSSSGGFAGLVDLGANHASSGRIGVVGSTADGRVSYNEALRVEFFDIATGQAGVTDFFSWTTDRLGNRSTVWLEAYDLAGDLLVRQSWLDTGLTTLSLSLANMHSVVFYGAGSTALDDLRFNAVGPAVAVPEPGTAALLALGMAGLLLRRRPLPTRG